MEEAVRSAIKKALIEKQNSIKDFVATGKCESYEEYSREIGRIAGIGEALFIVRDVINKHYQEQEDD